jgi:hypothetical protein
MSEIGLFTQNEDRSLILVPKTDNQESVLLRTYSGINLMDFSDILERENDGLHTDIIDIETMLSNFNGMSFF